MDDLTDGGFDFNTWDDMAEFTDPCPQDDGTPEEPFTPPANSRCTVTVLTRGTLGEVRKFLDDVGGKSWILQHPEAYVAVPLRDIAILRNDPRRHPVETTIFE